MRVLGCVIRRHENTSALYSVYLNSEVNCCKRYSHDVVVTSMTSYYYDVIVWHIMLNAKVYIFT
jgi:uncharacterized protein YceH (UPF0502 family)